MSSPKAASAKSKDIFLLIKYQKVSLTQGKGMCKYVNSIVPGMDREKIAIKIKIHCLTIFALPSFKEFDSSYMGETVTHFITKTNEHTKALQKNQTFLFMPMQPLQRILKSFSQDKNC